MDAQIASLVRIKNERLGSDVVSAEPVRDVATTRRLIAGAGNVSP